MTAAKGSLRKVETPEWLKYPSVCVRIMTVGEMREIEALGDDITDIDKMIAFFMACVCRSDGVRLYGPEDHESVLAIPWTVVQRCAEAAIELNGLTADDLEGN